MSSLHPIVAVTGSSGAGTSTVKRAFEHIFAREGITPAVVEGDSYHRYERMAMKEKDDDEKDGTLGGGPSAKKRTKEEQEEGNEGAIKRYC